MKISKSDYPLIASMRLAGMKWAPIAAVYGVTSGHLRDIQSDIMATTTIGDKINLTDFATVNMMKLSVRSMKDADRVNASKALLALGGVVGVAEEDDKSDDSKVRLEIIRELSK